MGTNELFTGMTKMGEDGGAGMALIIDMYALTGQRGDPGMGASGITRAGPPVCLVLVQVKETLRVL